MNLYVSPHAERSLIALTQKLPVPASVLLRRLRQTEAPLHSVALEICRLKFAHGVPHETSNGDSVVAIIRFGEVVTVMLRRSYNESFEPGILRVDEFVTWKGDYA